MHSDVKYFLLVKLSSHAVCSAAAVDFCLWRQNVIATSNGAVPPRQAFLTQPEESKVKDEIRKVPVPFGALGCDVASFLAKDLQPRSCRPRWEGAYLFLCLLASVFRWKLKTLGKRCQAVLNKTLICMNLCNGFCCLAGCCLKTPTTSVSISD